MARKLGPGGCLVLLALFGVQTIILFGCIYLGMEMLQPWILATGLIKDDAGAALIGIFTGMLVAAPPMILIDKWAKQLTGHSVMDNIPYIP